MTPLEEVQAASMDRATASPWARSADRARRRAASGNGQRLSFFTREAVRIVGQVAARRLGSSSALTQLGEHAKAFHDRILPQRRARITHQKPVEIRECAVE